MAHYESKHGTVSRRREELYMVFVDLRNFTAMLPEQYRDSVEADYDTLKVSARGFNIAVRVTERQPYSLMRLNDEAAPFHFCISLHFDEAGVQDKTDFSIELDADLNLLMKSMLGGKLREALDRIVDALVAVSEGRMPEGVPSDLKF